MAKPNKTSDDLAVPFYRTDCSANELEYVHQVLDSGWLTTAGFAAEFETRFAELTNAKHALAVNSCTAALHLALVALDVGPGDKVLLPTFTFAATAEVIQYTGATPVFLDVEYESAAIDAPIVEAALRAHPETKVLMVVHYGGQAAPMLDTSAEGILSLCRKHGVRIVEDAAHALPSLDSGKMVGSIGDITCFSFYANKTMTTGEGGMLTTGDSDLAQRVRLMRLHGIDRDVWTRYTQTEGRWEYDVVAAGFKYNLADINAAIGVAQLERLQSMRDAREQVAMRYMEELSDIKGLSLPEYRVAPEAHAWHLFTIRILENARQPRNALIASLNNDGIGTSVHYKPLHRMSFYRERYALSDSEFPVAERLWSQTVSLPIFSLLQHSEQSRVIESLGRHLR